MSKPTNQELMKAVADVLDEALAEYEKLSKGMGIDEAEQLSLDAQAKPVGEAGIGGPGQKPMMAKEEAPAEPVMEDKEDEKDEDEDEEKLMQTYKSLVAKMEKRGLMHKMKAKEEKVHKSETADARFESLAKAIKDVSETVKKIATAPAAPRKGLAGYAPLRKSEEGSEGKSLRKSEIVNKLIELKKSGTAGIDTGLINRVETSRLNPSDIEAIKSLGILG